MNESNICTLSRARAGGDVLASLGCEHCSCARKTGVNRFVPRRSSRTRFHESRYVDDMIINHHNIVASIRRKVLVELKKDVQNNISTFSGRCDATVALGIAFYVTY